MIDTFGSTNCFTVLSLASFHHALLSCASLISVCYFFLNVRLSLSAMLSNGGYSCAIAYPNLNKPLLLCDTLLSIKCYQITALNLNKPQFSAIDNID